MISTADFVTIPYTHDMTQVGIKYACQSFPYTYNRMGSDRFNWLRCSIAGKAVELAFKRHLNNFEVPHNMLGTTPFTDPDHFDIAFGGRRCVIQRYLITQKKHIRTVRKEPDRLLRTQALVPVDQINSDHLSVDDIYIFAFLTALITPNRHSITKAISAGQPIYMIHAFPQKWACPEQWGSLGMLAVKSNMESVIQLEIGGQDKHRKFQTENLILEHHVRMAVNKNFSALSYFYTPNLPDETIGVHRTSINETYIIEPTAWSNIWVYGMEIILGGYITRGEFRRKAIRPSKGSRVFDCPCNRTEGFMIPLKETHPLYELFDRAKAWSHERKSR